MKKRNSKVPTSVDETFVDPESADPEPERASATPDPLIGATMLDTYEIERLMGEGGMGRIYEARHVRIAEKRFAIKVLRPELVSSAQIRGRFEREVEAVARVTHPGVVAIADVGTTPQGLPFMVCEHLSGLDLLAYTRRFGALSDARVVDMVCRIAEALEAVHRGEDIVVVTPTASGKTLCYALPALQAIADDPSARALFLFPTKALGQDQVTEFGEL